MTRPYNKYIAAHWKVVEQTLAVPDLVTSKTETLFVLESPHTEELKTGVPASGMSGKAMTRVLFNRMVQEPMGEFVQQEMKATDYKYKIGIANVSTVPLQNSAYGMEERRFHAGLFVLVDWYRQQWMNKEFNDDRLADIEALVLNSFFERLQKYKNVKTLIPCGRFAQYYCSICARVLTHLKVIYGVPHPSQGLWDRDAEQIRQKIVKYLRSE